MPREPGRRGIARPRADANGGGFRRVTRPARVRAAIIGAGLMGRWHARAVEHAGATINAVVDADLDRARQLARAHRARAASSLSDAASYGTLDVVHVCTPLETHATLT